jgi:exosortase/archaeosortase family protein
MQEHRNIPSRWLVFATMLALALALPYTWLGPLRSLAGADPGALIPFLAPLVLALLALQAFKRYPEHTRVNLPLALALSLIGLGLIGIFPRDAGYIYWYLRVDIIAYLVFVLAFFSLIGGVRMFLTENLRGTLILILSLPPFLSYFYAQLAQGVTWLSQGAAAWITSQINLGVEYLGEGKWSGGGEVYSLTEACAGLESLTLIIFMIPLVLLLTTGPSRWRWGPLIALVPLYWLANLVRVLILLSLAGEPLFDLVHTLLGLTFTLLLLLFSLYLMHRKGVKWSLPANTVILTRSHINTGAVLYLALLIPLSWFAHGPAKDALNLAWGQDATTRVEVQDDEITIKQLDNYQIRYDRNLAWFQPYYGGSDEAHAGLWTIWKEAENPVYAQIVLTPNIGKLQRYSEFNCFITHGAKIRQMSRVKIGGGRTALVTVQDRNDKSWLTISWIDRAQIKGGEEVYRRVILFQTIPPTGSGSDPGYLQGILNPGIKGYDEEIKRGREVALELSS